MVKTLTPMMNRGSELPWMIVGSGASRSEIPWDYREDYFVVGLGTQSPAAHESFDMWVEVHGADGVAAKPRYLDFLRETEIGVLVGERCTLELIGDGPSRMLIDWPALEAEHGSEFLSCTPAIVLAIAVSARPPAVALFGINQGLKSVYSKERHGTLHFVRMLLREGTPIILPQDCPLLMEAPRYGQATEG